MTYYRDLETAEAESPCDTYDTCVCCGKLTDGPMVGYDLILPNEEAYTRVLIHRNCAFVMAQRLILDTWPNRNTGGDRMMAFGG